MAENGKIYPEWVQAYRTRGHTVKKVGNNYYLYKHTSKRVAGKKYPQPVDTYIGVITENGLVTSGKKKVSLTATSVEVREYGFSKAVWMLCPPEWKKALGDDWETVLLAIISNYMPETYLLKDREIRKETLEQHAFAAQIRALNRRMKQAYGAGLEELMLLSSIYLVYLEKETIVSKISDAQQQMLDELGLDILC